MFQSRLPQPTAGCLPQPSTANSRGQRLISAFHDSCHASGMAKEQAQSLLKASQFGVLEWYFPNLTCEIAFTHAAKITLETCIFIRYSQVQMVALCFVVFQFCFKTAEECGKKGQDSAACYARFPGLFGDFSRDAVIHPGNLTVRP